MERISIHHNYKPPKLFDFGGYFMFTDFSPESLRLSKKDTKYADRKSFGLIKAKVTNFYSRHFK
jgi:hypothetical protein